MEANAPPAGSWHRRLRPPRPPVGAWESPSLSSLPPGSRYTADLGILTKMLRPFLTSALARGQRGSAIIFLFSPHTFQGGWRYFIDAEKSAAYRYLRARALPGRALALATKRTLQWYTGIWLFRPAGGLKLETQRSSSRSSSSPVGRPPKSSPVASVGRTRDTALPLQL